MVSLGRRRRGGQLSQRLQLSQRGLAARTGPDAAAVTRASPPVTPQSTLPSALPVLYGRDADLVALAALIDAHGLVTVVGAGGIGKSRLAQAVAHAQAGRWPDGAWMVELAGLSDPVRLANAVAQALHITLAGQADALDQADGLPRLASVDRVRRAAAQDG